MNVLHGFTWFYMVLLGSTGVLDGIWPTNNSEYYDFTSQVGISWDFINQEMVFLDKKKLGLLIGEE